MHVDASVAPEPDKISRRKCTPTEALLMLSEMPNAGHNEQLGIPTLSVAFVHVAHMCALCSLKPKIRCSMTIGFVTFLVWFFVGGAGAIVESVMPEEAKNKNGPEQLKVRTTCPGKSNADGHRKNKASTRHLQIVLLSP